ncbi:MAG: elongation factor G [Chloroflexota bacterium]
MKEYGTEAIRNTVLLSHSGAGKTSLAEAILFTAKATTRLGKVSEGSAVSDYDPEENKRQISINLSILPCEWQDTKINLLDTPGYADFVGEVRAALRISDTALIVVDAYSGVEVGTDQVWGYCEERKLPRFIFVNKMDRENADFAKVVANIQDRFGSKCLPMQVPIGAHTTFKGVMDVLSQKAYLGTEGKEGEAPAEAQAAAAAFREKLVEAIAETDDKLIEKYLGGEELTAAELGANIGKAITGGSLVPIMVGSALQNVGMGLLLDAMVAYLPSPAVSAAGSDLKPDPAGPLAALVFKTSADPYVGRLTYFRVYSGTIESNAQAWNANRNAAERIGQLYMLRGKNQEAVARVVAGDIGAVAKLNVTSTGDTLCRQDKPVKLEPVDFPEPIYSLSVYPRTKVDVDKMGPALARMAEEDMAIRVRREMDTAEVLLLGIGETHLEVTAEKMARKFSVNVDLATPKVPYKETIMTPTKSEYKHRKQTGGHGQYGHVLLEVEPLPRGTGNEFGERVVGGSVPKNYIPAVEKGVNEGFHAGVLAHYPVTDVKAVLYDGSFHPVDSSEICFKIAGSQALKRGLSQGQPILLEPVVIMKIMVPNDLTGDIIGDLNTKRARVLGMNPAGDWNEIEAQAPLAEVQRYAIDLRSMTQGRANYTATFSHYEEVPAHLSQKIIAERQAEEKAEKE